MELFAQTLENRDIQEVTKDEKKFKMCFNVYKEQEDYEKADKLPQEGIRVKVKFSQYKDETTAIEISKLAGSSAQFRDELGWMKEILGGFADTVPEEYNQIAAE